MFTASHIKQIRTFIATTEILIDPKVPVLANMGEQVFKYAVGLLRQKPEFSAKYEATQKANTPHKMGFGCVPKSDNAVDCFIQWQKGDGYGMGVPDKTTFVLGGDTQVPGTSLKFSWSVFISFAE